MNPINNTVALQESIYVQQSVFYHWIPWLAWQWKRALIGGVLVGTEDKSILSLHLCPKRGSNSICLLLWEDFYCVADDGLLEGMSSKTYDIPFRLSTNRSTASINSWDNGIRIFPTLSGIYKKTEETFRERYWISFNSTLWSFGIPNSTINTFGTSFLTLVES